MKRMKIGIEAQRLFREKKHGMDIVALETIKSLVKQFPDTDFVIFVKKDSDNNVLPQAKNVSIVETKAMPYPIWEQWYLPRLCKEYGVDILHCTSNTAPIFTPVPLVVTLHDIIYLEGNPLKGGTAYQRFGNLYRAWNVPRIVKKAKKVITVSDYEKERINQHFKLPENNDQVVRIYNAVGSHFQPIAKSDIPKAWLEKAKLPERFLLFLGNTDPKKNLDNMLRALSLLRQQGALPMPVVMPDFGETHLLEELKKIGDLSLRANIHLTGYLPNQELPYLYNLSELFVYPSRRESFGIPPLEAMACGVAVISSATSSMPEVGGDAAVYIQPEDPETIANAITQLLTDATLREAHIEKGIRHASKFHWDQTASEVHALYEAVFHQVSR